MLSFQCFYTIYLVSYIKLTFKLKTETKCVILKTWNKFEKPEKKFEIRNGNLV